MYIDKSAIIFQLAVAIATYIVLIIIVDFLEI